MRIKQYILFHNKRRPSDMDKHEAEQFLYYIASEISVAASSQNESFNALMFL
jgi:hypothetical protein